MGINVLVYAEAWGFGGIESYLMGTFRALSQRGCQFKLFTTWDWSNARDGELEKLGIDRISLFKGYRPGQIRRLNEGLKGFCDQLDEGQWDAVHINTMNGAGFSYALAAEKRGVPIRIVHSHNSDVGEGGRAAKRLAHAFLRSVLSGHENVRLACSKEAGRHLFGRSQFKVLNNGIDTAHFAFDVTLRNSMRSALGVPAGALLFGNPSRLAPAKNPLFQLDVFSEIVKRDDSAFYLMQNNGDLSNEVHSHARNLGIDSHLILFDPISDSAGLYSALDVMLFPSLYEGLSIAALEAQCSGLPILASNRISEETFFSDIVVLKSLDSSKATWAEEALLLANSKRGRVGYDALAKKMGFDYHETSEELLQIYCSNDGGWA